MWFVKKKGKDAKENVPPAATSAKPSASSVNTVGQGRLVNDVKNAGQGSAALGYSSSLLDTSSLLGSGTSGSGSASGGGFSLMDDIFGTLDSMNTTPAPAVDNSRPQPKSQYSSPSVQAAGNGSASTMKTFKLGGGASSAEPGSSTPNFLDRNIAHDADDDTVSIRDIRRLMKSGSSMSASRRTSAHMEPSRAAIASSLNVPAAQRSGGNTGRPTSVNSSQSLPIGPSEQLTTDAANVAPPHGGKFSRNARAQAGSGSENLQSQNPRQALKASLSNTSLANGSKLSQSAPRKAALGHKGGKPMQRSGSGSSESASVGSSDEDDKPLAKVAQSLPLSRPSSRAGSMMSIDPHHHLQRPPQSPSGRSSRTGSVNAYEHSDAYNQGRSNSRPSSIRSGYAPSANGLHPSSAFDQVRRTSSSQSLTSAKPSSPRSGAPPSSPAMRRVNTTGRAAPSDTSATSSNSSGSSNSMPAAVPAVVAAGSPKSPASPVVNVGAPADLVLQQAQAQQQIMMMLAASQYQGTLGGMTHQQQQQQQQQMMLAYLAQTAQQQQQQQVLAALTAQMQMKQQIDAAAQKKKKKKKSGEKGSKKKKVSEPVLEHEPESAKEGALEVEAHEEVEE
ncbi:hypothetical protein HK101_002089 [Irineochytrium annulatum]|nr:hypothetical protein HK101_002089 [Irineochytrium annulatum]